MANYIVTNNGLVNADKLMHKDFKYVKKEFKNGKWKYYYEGDSVTDPGSKVLYEKTEGNPDDKYGTYTYKDSKTGNESTVHVTKKVQPFSGKSTGIYSSTISDGEHGVQTVTEGSLERAYDKTKNAVKSLFNKEDKKQPIRTKEDELTEKQYAIANKRLTQHKNEAKKRIAEKEKKEAKKPINKAKKWLKKKFS